MSTRYLQCGLAFIALCATACDSDQQDHSVEKPRIVEVFACSDYCPGPREAYMKKVYEGVDNETACLAVGGTPYVYTGWGEFFICLAE